MDDNGCGIITNVRYSLDWKAVSDVADHGMELNVNEHRTYPVVMELIAVSSVVGR